MRKSICSRPLKHAVLCRLFCPYWYKSMLYIRMCIFANEWFNHLGILEHAQVSVHAQGSGFMAGTFVKLGCLVEFPLVGIDVCQEQLIVVLTPLLPLLQIRQHKHGMWAEINACTPITCVFTHTMSQKTQKALTTTGLLDAVNLTSEPTLNSYTIDYNETREQIQCL